MVAIGGWGDTKGFSEAVTSEAAMNKFAQDVETMVKTHGLDGIGKTLNDFSTLPLTTSLTMFRY
jgi:hypothetical protein